MNRKMYLIHPLETYGTVEKNRRDEELIAQNLIDKFKDLPSLELVRPFKEIPPGTARDEALQMGLDLLKGCDGVILSGEWERSEGCLKELMAAAREQKEVFTYIELLYIAELIEEIQDLPFMDQLDVWRSLEKVSERVIEL